MCYPFVAAKVQTFPQSAKQKNALCSNTVCFIDINHLKYKFFQKNISMIYFIFAIFASQRLNSHIKQGDEYNHNVDSFATSGNSFAAVYMEDGYA